MRGTQEAHVGYVSLASTVVVALLRGKLFVTLRATSLLSITATMVLRHRHSSTFIGRLRPRLWTRRLHENKQDQQHKLDPVPYHTRFLPLGSRQFPSIAVSSLSIIAGQCEKRR